MATIQIWKHGVNTSNIPPIGTGTGEKTKAVITINSWTKQPGLTVDTHYQARIGASSGPLYDKVVCTFADSAASPDVARFTIVE